MNSQLFATVDGDNDDVRAALVTAASYHRHQQLAHCLRWLRHAAQLAADSGRRARSQQLHASAQQLDELAIMPTHRGPPPTAAGVTSSTRHTVSSAVATRRSPYPNQVADRQFGERRMRLDSPTDIRLPSNTMRNPGTADDEPPSMLGHATVHGSPDGPLSSFRAPPTQHDGGLVQADHEFLIVDEATRSSNPGAATAPATAPPIDLSRTISAVQDAPPPARASMPGQDEDEDVTTLTTSAPMKVAVFSEDGDGAARVILWSDGLPLPAGAVLALLIPVNPAEIGELRTTIGYPDDS